MGTIDLPKNSRILPSGTPLLHTQRPMDEELLSWILNEETTALIHQMNAVGLTEQLFGTIHQYFRNVLKHYGAIGEEHIRDGLGGEDTGLAVCFTPSEIADLLLSSGGTFSTGEIEKTAVKTAGKNDAEKYAFPIVRCAFMDNTQKPKTVMDIRFAVNIPDSVLIGPDFYHQALIRYILKGIAGKRVIESLNGEVHEQTLIERITGICSEIDPAVADIRGHAAQLADIDHIRAMGFGMAIHSFTAILGASELDSQFIDYPQDGNELVIREYEDTDSADLPDERYQIRLRYFDKIRLAEARAAYDTLITNLERNIQQLWDLLEVLYRDSKSIFGIHDFEDLVKKNLNRVHTLPGNTAGEPHKTAPVPGVSPAAHTGDTLRLYIARMRERVNNMYNALSSKERQVIGNRLDLLEQEILCLDKMINPYQLSPGLLVDIEITSIKRKNTTMAAVARVLREFLRQVPADFHDAVSAVFGTRPPAGQAEKGAKKPKSTLPAKASPRTL